MPDQQTRDIAMRAQALIDHHMMDCETFRENLRADMKESRENSRDDLKDFREEIKKLNWRVAGILGGLMVAVHAIDWFLALAGHK